jgi:hypothetical protein
VELRRATKEQISGLRAAKREQSDLKIVPGFYAGLVEEAEAFLVVEAAAAGRPPAEVPPAGRAASGPEPESTLGYALMLGRKHGEIGRASCRERV